MEDLEKANSTQEKLNIEELGEGDLFGVRAIERGFFGGVSQSRSNSPAQSMFGPPSSIAIDLPEASTRVEAVRVPSAASSSSDSDLSRSFSESSVPQSIKQKPSPLRLQPSNAEIRRSARPNVGGSYIPPSPINNTQSQSNSIGVSIGRPSIAEFPPIRIQSDDELSQSRYKREVPRSYMFLAGQHSSVMSQAGSIYGNAEIPPNNLAHLPKTPTPPAPTHVFGLPPKSTQRRPQFISPVEVDNENSSRSPQLPVPSIPSPFKYSYQPITLFEEPETKTKRRSYQPTSIEEPETNTKRRSYQPSFPSDAQPEQELYTHYREPSLATSTLTTRTSILDDLYSSRIDSDRPSASQPRGRPAHKHTRSNSSNSHTAQHTHAQISRTTDSIRISRKSSQVQGHRISRDRDQLHYDPTSAPTARNRSGSLQGRAVNFDRPRESPFSNANAISERSVKGHGSNDSLSSVSSSSSEDVRESSREGRGRGRSGIGSASLEGDEEADGGRGRGRTFAGEDILEVMTPMTATRHRFDASDNF